MKEPGEYGYEEPHEDQLNELQAKLAEAITAIQERIELLAQERIESHLGLNKAEVERMTEGELEEAWDTYYLAHDSGWGWEAEADWQDTEGQIQGLKWAADVLQILAHGEKPAEVS